MTGPPKSPAGDSKMTLVQPLAITSIDNRLDLFDRFSQLCLRFQRLRKGRQTGCVRPSLGLPQPGTDHAFWAMREPDAYLKMIVALLPKDVTPPEGPARQKKGVAGARD